MKRVLMLVVLIAVLLAGAFLNETRRPVITGYAVKSASDVQIEMEIIAADNSLKMLGDGAQLCAVVEIDKNNTYYYGFTKTPTTVDVKNQYCADAKENNVIVKFNSYDELESFRSDPAGYLQSKANTGYYFFPSANIAKGGAVNCNADFQAKYCGVAYYYLTQDQMRSAQLNCCADYSLSSDMKNRLVQLKTGASPVLQSPFDFLTSLQGLAAIGALVVVIIGTSAFLVLRKPKQAGVAPELDHYITTSLQQGFTPEQIKRELLETGWEEKTIDDAMQKITSKSKPNVIVLK